MELDIRRVEFAQGPRATGFKTCGYVTNGCCAEDHLILCASAAIGSSEASATGATAASGLPISATSNHRNAAVEDELRGGGFRL